MEKVRVGVVGAGIRGGSQAKDFSRVTERAELAAICDADPNVLKNWPMVPTFSSSEEMIRSGKVDAIYIATPHYAHTTIGIDALKNGIRAGGKADLRAQGRRRAPDRRPL